jgi:dethiobiotin synthetase
VAAAHAGRRVDLGAVRRAFADMARRHAWLVVEGAGGLLVPIRGRLDMADLAGELGLPLVVVTRASLGTINHTRLTLEAAARRGLPVAGVVISHSSGRLSPPDAANLAALRAELGPLRAGEIPPLRPGQEPPPGALDVGRLVRRARAAARARG